AGIGESGSEGSAGRPAREDTFFTRQAARPVERGAIIDTNHFVHDRWIIILRKDLHANALNLIRPGGITGKDRTGGACSENFYLWVLFVQKARCTGDSATGAYSGYESAYAPGSITPDLRSRGSIVGGGIGGIGILIWATRSWDLVGEPVRHIFIVIW